jgi:Rap1a immunity proteins
MKTSRCANRVLTRRSKQQRYCSSASPTNGSGTPMRRTGPDCVRAASADGLTLWQVGQPETAKVCIPKTVSEQELIAVASNYVRRNPNDRDLRISVVLGLAFMETWPCKH